MFNRIEHYFGDQLGNCKIAVWGLAFKALTDDVRESPAITLAQRLIGAGASLAVHDPKPWKPPKPSWAISRSNTANTCTTRSRTQTHW